jgi:CheY-like chemotaxis protein
MDFNHWASLIGLIISFLQVIIWPLVILLILFYLRKPLKKFLEEIIEVNFKAGPIETTARRQNQMVAAASLAAATIHWGDAAQDKQQAQVAEKTKEVVRAVDQLITPSTSRQLEGTSVLWVDDRPADTTYERQALEALGIQFTLSRSTEDALERLARKSYALIISDMARPPDQHAGYTLLDKVKAMHITTPFIIYASGKKPEYIAEARRRGAFGDTNEPRELFEFVVHALKNG